MLQSYDQSLYLELSNECEGEMATHSSVLACRIPGTGEPGGLLSLGLHRVGHDSRDLAAATAMNVKDDDVDYGDMLRHLVPSQSNQYC